MSIASPVHQPLVDNYSHTEVRVRCEEDGDSEPQAGRGLASKVKKTAFRSFIRENLKLHLLPKAKPVPAKREKG
jgi:hypothetical protein